MKKKGGLYKYLDSSGVLNTGNDALIRQAKKAYYKQYKASWRKQQRQETKEITVILSPLEIKLIAEHARQHKRSQSAFIKSACIAYLNKRYVVPDILALNSIRELLTMNYAVLKKRFDENALSYQAGITFLNQIAVLEKNIIDQLQSPVSLEDLIINTIKEKPEYKGVLYQLLQNT